MAYKILTLQRIQIPTGRQGRYGAVGGGCGHLTDGLGAAIARHEHTGDGGLGTAVLSCGHVAVVVELDHVGEGGVLGDLTDADEGAVHGQGGLLPRVHVAEAQTLKGVATKDARYHGGVDEGHVVSPCQDVLQAGLARQVGKVLHYGDVGTALGEENSLLKGGVTAADDGHGLALVEGAVADGAVGNALAYEFLLVFHTQIAMTGARGDNGSLALKGAALTGDCDVSCLTADADYGVQLDVGTQFQCLTEELLAQLRAAEADESGVVLHTGRVSDLPAEGGLLNEKHALLGSAGVNGGGQTRRARADDDDVVHVKPRIKD